MNATLITRCSGFINSLEMEVLALGVCVDTRLVGTVRFVHIEVIPE